MKPLYVALLFTTLYAQPNFAADTQATHSQANHRKFITVSREKFFLARSSKKPASSREPLFNAILAAQKEGYARYARAAAVTPAGGTEGKEEAK